MALRKAPEWNDHSKVTTAIQKSFRKLCEHPAFAAWKKEEPLAAGDLVVVNNSFIFRSKVTTNKNRQFLACEVEKGDEFALEPVVAEGIRLNVDLKRIPSKSKKRPACESLDKAVERELKQLGQLVFLLAGSVEDTVRIEEPIEDAVFISVVLDPRLKSEVQIEDGAICIKRIGNEDQVWEAIKTKLSGEKMPEPTEDLKQKVGNALESASGRAHAILRLPSLPKVSEPSVLDSIVAVLAEQQAAYAESLSKCHGEQSHDADGYNNMLRVAYNFTSDATSFLRLLVSICDLKPIVQWCTVGEQFKLSEAFRALPWARSRYKASLASYEEIVGDARNRAFHRLFPFTKPIDVVLPGSALTDVRLRIFSEYSKKKENELTYQDKEMVDLLREFTITREHSVPSGFWPRNDDVMRATIEVFEAVSRTLKLLLECVRT
ncbi:MAG: hypothetical protein WA613_13405 [Candidatus Acidiferrales bacterium]